MYGAAFALHPEYHRLKVADIDDGQPLEDLDVMVKRLLIDYGSNSAAAIAAASNLGENGPVGKCMAQFARYKAGDFKGRVHSAAARHVTGAAWWQTLGRPGMHELSTVAMYVLSMVLAAAGCERNWSFLGDITSGKHARMGPETIGKVAFVRANLQLMHREHMKDVDNYAEEGVEWDDDGIPSCDESDSGSLSACRTTDVDV